MEWHYSNGANRMGPVSPVAFETLVRDGVVKADTLVWAQGQAAWQPWNQFAALIATCAAGGGIHFQRDMVPYEGKFISAEQKEKFFQRLREGVAQPGQLVYASFDRRFVAKVIDGIVMQVVGVIVNMGLAYVVLGAFIFNPKPSEVANPGRMLVYTGATLLVGLGVGLLYQWFFLKNYAATPGKMALGLKVVRSDGSPLTTGRIFGRVFSEYLSVMILFIGYIMAGFDEERRTLHDRICDTRVIKS